MITVEQDINPREKITRQEFISPLDDPKLSPFERARSHDKLTREVIKQALFSNKQKGERVFLANQDILAGHIYLREVEGSDTCLIGIIGFVKSDITGLTGTPFTMYIRGKKSEWENLSQEERRNKFLKEHLPKINSVQVFLHGWGATNLVFEEPIKNMMIKKTDSQDPIASDQTLIISLSRMGANNSLSIKEEEIKQFSFNKFSGPIQVLEALDHIGYLINHELIEQIIEGNQPEQFSDEEKKLLFTGKYFHEMVHNIVGHSMGGLVAFRLYAANYLTRIFKDIKELYWNKLSTNLKNSYDEMVRRYYSEKPELKDTSFFDSETHDYLLFPNAKFHCIAPVIQGVEIDRRSEGKHVSFLRHPIIGPLINLLIKIYKNKTGKKLLEKNVVKAFELIILQLILNYLIDKKSLGSKEIRAIHAQQILYNFGAVAVATEIIDSMEEIIQGVEGNKGETIRAINQELASCFHIFYGLADKILNPKTVVKIENLFQQQGLDPFQLITKIKDSGHYLNLEGWKEVKNQMNQWINKNIP
jgi:hypothetical protein